MPVSPLRGFHLVPFVLAGLRREESYSPECGTQEDFVYTCRSLCVRSSMSLSWHCLTTESLPRTETVSWAGSARTAKPSRNLSLWLGVMPVPCTNCQESTGDPCCGNVCPLIWLSLGMCMGPCKAHSPRRMLKGRFSSSWGTGKSCTSFSRTGLIIWSGECIWFIFFSQVCLSMSGVSYGTQ